VHDTYQIGVALDRGGAYRFRRATRPVPTRGLVIVHPGEVHSVGDTEPRAESMRFLMMYADAGLLHDLRDEMSRRPGTEPYFEAAVFDADLVRTFLALFSVGDWTLERETRLAMLFSGLIARHADERVSPIRGPRPRAALQCARDYLHARPTSNVSLAELEVVSGLSRYHLVRQFSRAFGLPPHAYHVQLRIDVARRLLASGMPVARVVSATGFYDQSHFGRHFRRLVGATPGRYGAHPPHSRTTSSRPSAR
jgi:AraC-like DNA-binding protein